MTTAWPEDSIEWAFREGAHTAFTLRQVLSRAGGLRQYSLFAATLESLLLQSNDAVETLSGCSSALVISLREGR